MFDFSMRIEPEIKAPTLNLFREGQLFEGYIFGFKDDKDETELIGRKKPDTISAIKKQSEYAKPMFAPRGKRPVLGRDRPAESEFPRGQGT